MENLTFRLATPTHYRQILKLLQQQDLESDTQVTEPREELEHEARSLHNHHHHAVVALENEKVIGFAAGTIAGHFLPDEVKKNFYKYEPEEKHHPTIGYLSTVYVSPEHRKKGLSQKLTKDLLFFLETEGCRRTYALQDKNSKEQAHQLEEAGFEKIDELSTCLKIVRRANLK